VCFRTGIFAAAHHIFEWRQGSPTEIEMKTQFKIAAAALLLAGSVTAASAQVYGVPGVDYGYPPYAPAPQATRGHFVAPMSQRVYENGKLIGQDPDPNVRLMLEKDYSFQ
jgi:hypothetical protein